MISQYDYHCPKCDGKLSEDNKVLFHVKTTDQEMVKLFLDPKPRSYKYNCHPWVDFKENEVVDFVCPHCNESLTSEKYSKFVQITLKVTDKVLFDVFFSRVYGDHRTYVGIEDFEEEYGGKITS